MTISELVSSIEHKVRPYWSILPPYFAVRILSVGRKLFLKQLSNERPQNKIIIPKQLRRKLWDIDFGSPIMNAAGMFKNGDGYYLASYQGAGAYLAGTTTSLFRSGNIKNGITHPFASYPLSGSASNWMGLPNAGHDLVAKKLSKIEKRKYCPIGVSISANSDNNYKEGLEGLLDGLVLYDKANVDFIEINESCPNVPHDSDFDSISGLDKKLLKRLEFIEKNFLKTRKRNLPVIVKFSNDTDINLLPALLEVLLVFGFDGVNFGNTSTNYIDLRKSIVNKELALFDYFTEQFGGGISGRLLKNMSLDLATFTCNYIKTNPPKHEFHIIRTGGIEAAEDLKQSENAGIKLNQWFSGYFDNFSMYGHNLYKYISEELVK